MTVAWPDGWPRTPLGRQRYGQFHSTGPTSWGGRGKTSLTIAQAISRVQDEVRRMGGSHLRIDTDLQMRNDGLPRSGQRAPDDPGAVVSFRLPGNKPVVLPCDRYTKVEQNLAAIAATLEAKRAIERHGVSTLDREFEGYRALPPGGSAPAPTVPARSPWDVLGVLPGTDPTTCEIIYKAKARTAHPDITGGSASAMLELNQAIAAIREGRA